MQEATAVALAAEPLWLGTRVRACHTRLTLAYHNDDARLRKPAQESIAQLSEFRAVGILVPWYIYVYIVYTLKGP